MKMHKIYRRNVRKIFKVESIGSGSAHSYIDEFNYKKKFNFYLPNDILVGVGELGREYGKKLNGISNKYKFPFY